MRIIIINQYSARVHYRSGRTFELTDLNGDVRRLVQLWLMPLDAPPDTPWDTVVQSLDSTAAIEVQHAI